MAEACDITILLRKWEEGDPTASEALFALVYPQLKRIAGSLFHTGQSAVLQPTGLVNELYLKLLQQRRLSFKDRGHFFSLAAHLMRRILVDQARFEGRRKRKGQATEPLHENLAWIHPASPEMLDLDNLLKELERIDARKCRMVELRFFLGLTAEETAQALKLSKATVDRDLKFVCVWLYDRFQSVKR